MTRLGTLVLLLAVLAPAAQLEIETVDSAGQAVWARIEVRADDGKMYRPSGAMRDRTAASRGVGGPWYLGSYVAEGKSTVEAPAGEYLVVVERGPEFERFEQRITLSDAEPARIVAAPERWIDMNELGWYSADFQVHRNPEDVAVLLDVEDLNLAVALTMGNVRDAFASGPLPKNPINEIAKGRVVTIANAEDDRGGGSWAFHMLRSKMKLPAADSRLPLGVELIVDAKEQRYVETAFPWTAAETPLGWETPVAVALSTPDSIGVMHDRVLQYGVVADSGRGRPVDPDRYPGERGFVEYNFEQIYRYWNLGYRIPATAGSGTGSASNPLGGNRVYVQIPGEPFAVEPLYRNLRQGRSMVTNGPVVFFDAVERPGREVVATVDVRSRSPLDRVEIVANGVVIETFGAPEGKRSFKAELNVRGGLYTWIAARVFAQDEETVRVAHSSPVWFDGAWGAADDAEYFIAWIDELLGQCESDPTRFRTPQERETVMTIYRQAREVYEARR